VDEVWKSTSTHVPGVSEASLRKGSKTSSGEDIRMILGGNVSVTASKHNMLKWSTAGILYCDEK
jgi:hypothetical protein